MQIDRYRSDVTCLLWSTNVAAPFGPIAEYQPRRPIILGQVSLKGTPGNKKMIQGPGVVPLPIWPPHCHHLSPKKMQRILTVSTRKSPCRSNLGRTVTIVVICQFSNQSQGLDKNIGFLELLIRLFQRWGSSHSPPKATQKLPSEAAPVLRKVHLSRWQIEG